MTDIIANIAYSTQRCAQHETFQQKPRLVKGSRDRQETETTSLKCHKIFHLLGETCGNGPAPQLTTHTKFVDNNNIISSLRQSSLSLSLSLSIVTLNAFLLVL
jgi:hypothetical protein